MSPLFNSLIAVLVVSLISLVGVIFLFLKSAVINRLSLYFVSFAVGSLLGDAIIHLLPQSYEKISSAPLVSLLILGGILLNFILEKFIRWRHCHDLDCHEFDDNDHSVVLINLLSDGLHNLIDGMLITAGFMVDYHLGLTTAIAVILHEIPQEIGDYAILVHHKTPPLKAVFLNFLSALTSFLGVFLTIIIGAKIENFSLYLLPITAGAFIYLAASDLIPELHRHQSKVSTSLIQLFSIILGIALMFLLLFVE